MWLSREGKERNRVSQWICGGIMLIESGEVERTVEGPLRSEGALEFTEAQKRKNVLGRTAIRCVGVVLLCFFPPC